MEALDTKLEKAVPQTQRASSGPEPTASEEASAAVPLWLVSPAAVERSAATEGRRKRQETMLMTMRLITSLQ